MKKTLLLFLFTNFLCITTAQNTWEFFRRENDIHEGMDMMIELKDGNFISTGGVYLGVNSEKSNENFSWIRKHSKISGNVYKEVNYKVDSMFTRLSWIFYDEDIETFTIAGEAHKYFDNEKRGYFIVTHWDSGLNLLNDTLIRLQPENENNNLRFMNGIITKSGDYIIIGNYYEYPKYPFQNNKLFFARISKKGIVQFTNWYRELGGDNHCSIIELENDKKYLLTGLTSYYIDNNFNILDSITTLNSIDYLFRYNSNAVSFADNKYLCSVRFNGNSQRGIGLFNPDMNIIKSVNISKQTNFNMSLILKNFDFIDTSAIFVGSQAYQSDYFTIAKVNSNLLPYWIKYFSEKDEIAHSISGLTATSDGGCIVFGIKGQKVTFTDLPYEYGSWALKLDANGNTVSTQDPGPGAWEITVFPNPSTGDFRIEITGSPAGNELLLYDLQGREVKKYQNLTEGTNTFMFDDLHQGTYIWKLINKGKEIGEGKWVKVGE